MPKLFSDAACSTCEKFTSRYSAAAFIHTGSVIVRLAERFSCAILITGIITFINIVRSFGLHIELLRSNEELNESRQTDYTTRKLNLLRLMTSFSIINPTFEYIAESRKQVYVYAE